MDTGNRDRSQLQIMLFWGGTLTLPRLDVGALNIAEMTSKVADEVILLRVVEDLLPESTRLLEVD